MKPLRDLLPVATNLANTQLVSFQGSQLEPNGPDLSGALGYEMYNLYLSVQYYQMVLDRFFSQTNTLYASFASPNRAFLGAGAVSSSMQKLLLASTRKARSWSEIAKRYHAINRADLAKHVIERAYSVTFLEMTILTRLLRRDHPDPRCREEPQIRSEIEIAAPINPHFSIWKKPTKNLASPSTPLASPKATSLSPRWTLFLQPPNPPTLSASLLKFAKEKMLIARYKEQLALQTKRSFDTSAASFQSELVRIRQNHETQLAEEDLRKHPNHRCFRAKSPLPRDQQIRPSFRTNTPP